MEITDIRFANVRPAISDGGSFGICSVEINGSIIIHGIKVKRFNGELRVTLPDRRVGKENVFKPVVTISNHEFANYLKQVVLTRYLEEVSKLWFKGGFIKTRLFLMYIVLTFPITECIIL